MGLDFIKSERPNNIFYGDIFRINGKGCLIFGNGKTKACREAINNEDDEIALDFACLTSDVQNIYGHFEMEIRAKNVPDLIGERIKLCYFIRMLDEKDTRKYLANNSTEIKSITLDDFVKMSKFNITYEVDFTKLIPEQENNEKLNVFNKIVSNHDIKCILVPWMKSHEEKGLLLKNYIK